MPIHPAAAEGFSRSAAAYERGRPEYPPAAIEWLRERLDLRPGRTVVDVAAGTGKLSRPLAATGAEVIAVEPVGAMREAIGPGVRVLEGTAESLPLPDESADAATVGQAFHWFDGDVALAELHRVLRPGGGLALVWNRRRVEDPVQAALEEILAPHRGIVPSHRRERWREAFERTRLFGPFEERRFPNEQVLDAEGLADRVGSISFIAALDDPARQGVLSAVRALAADGPVTLPYLGEVQICRRSPGSSENITRSSRSPLRRR
jgi:SAM-dependent methyltransferase